MKLKTAWPRLLIDPNKKSASKRFRTLHNRTPLQVVRLRTHDYLTAHGCSFVASGLLTDTAVSAGDETTAKRVSSHTTHRLLK
jgi:hypothetical protein